MDESDNSVSTQLLTLLNVSATRLNKRPRTEYEILPSKRLKLNVKGKSTRFTNSSTDLNITPTSPAALPNAAAESIQDIGIQAEADEETVELSEAQDPFYRHFGAHSSALTDVPSDFLNNPRWMSRSRILGLLSHVTEFLPDGLPPQDDRTPTKMTEKLLDVYMSRLLSMNNDMRTLCNDFMKVIGTYEDVYISNKVPRKHTAFIEATTIHCLNHVLRIRRRVLKNNERVARLSQSEESAEPPSDIQDQGFTRPKVLLLLPLRNSAFTWVRALLANSPTSQTENHSRFISEYTLPEGVTDRLAANSENYPPDHVETFSGNIDDTFRFGLKLTRKAFKLFSDFYSSDIIVASPLGLKILIEKDKSKSADFLSSIEILIMEQLDVMSMQNWEHVQFVMDHLNKLPTETRDSDFSRIKPWYLDGNAAKLRQSILFSSYETPEMRALFSKGLVNVAGKLRTEQQFPGVMDHAPKGVQQTFVRFNCASSIAELDARFEYFTQQVLPSLLKSAVKSVNTLIFVPSYFDFIRLRNYLKVTEDVTYVTLSEDSSNKDISRARQAFFSGQRAFLIMTERFHFYRRYRIRGVKNILFYGLPEHANYYVELLSFPFLDGGVEDAGDVSCKALFCRYDTLRLERIVGTKDARRMIGEKEDSFSFI